MRIRAQITSLQGALEILLAQEEQACASTPANLQWSEQHEESQAACQAMEEAISRLADAANGIRCAIG